MKRIISVELGDCTISPTKTHDVDFAFVKFFMQGSDLFCRCMYCSIALKVESNKLDSN